MFGLDKLMLCVLFVAGVLASPVFPDKKAFNRDFMHFGKRAAPDFYDIDGGDFNRAFMNFGKRDYDPMDKFMPDKKAFNREFMHFGKRSSPDMEPFGREFMHFGRRR